MTTQEENAAMDALAAPIEINYKAIVPCDESHRLATKLGTHFAHGLMQIQIEECLRENVIAVYPLERVREFMDAKVAALKASKPDEKYYYPSWAWHPLRAADLQRPRGLTPGNSQMKRYEKPVPVAVLMIVERIQDALGTQVRFYVADIRERVKVDPFLAVTAEGCPLYVIERWDEPAFRS
jgi:hypothetical protein